MRSRILSVFCLAFAGLLAASSPPSPPPPDQSSADWTERMPIEGRGLRQAAWKKREKAETWSVGIWA